MESVADLIPLPRTTLRDLRDSLEDHRLDLLDEFATLAGMGDDNPLIVQRRAEIEAEVSRTKVKVSRLNQAMAEQLSAKREARNERKAQRKGGA